MTSTYMIERLPGLSRTWYEDLPSVALTWKEWKKQLTTAFEDGAELPDKLSQMLA